MTALFNRRLIKPAIKVLCLNHIHNHMRILFPHQVDDIIHLIGGYHGVQQVHFPVAVASHGVHAGYPMPVLFHVSLNHILCIGGGNLQRDPLIPVMEGGNGFGGNKLE